MSDQPSDLLRRHAATSATLAKYRKRKFSWSGAATCVHMARFHLRRMGHAVEPLPARVRSRVGALRALKERGWDSVADMLDAQGGLYRIPPAMMLPGDLAMVADETGIGAIMICIGPHKLMGWREDADGLVVLDVTLAEIDASWRV